MVTATVCRTELWCNWVARGPFCAFSPICILPNCSWYIRYNWIAQGPLLCNLYKLYLAQCSITHDISEDCILQHGGANKFRMITEKRKGLEFSFLWVNISHFSLANVLPCDCVRLTLEVKDCHTCGFLELPYRISFTDCHSYNSHLWSCCCAYMLS